MSKIKITLSKNFIIRELYSLIESCTNEHQLDTLVSLIDFVTNTKEEIPMKSAKALLNR